MDASEYALRSLKRGLKRKKYEVRFWWLVVAFIAFAVPPNLGADLGFLYAFAGTVAIFGFWICFNEYQKEKRRVLILRDLIEYLLYDNDLRHLLREKDEEVVQGLLDVYPWFRQKFADYLQELRESTKGGEIDG